MTSKEKVAKISEALSTGAGFSGKILNYRKDGTLFWNYLRINPVFEGETLVAYIGIQIDITALKKEQNQKEASLRSEIDINHDLLQVIMSTRES